MSQPVSQNPPHPDRDLPIGYIVHWYQGGDTTQTPWPGTVASLNGNGSINLLLIQPGGHKPIRNVYHVSDPELKERPPLAQRYGGWDFVPGVLRPSEAMFLQQELKRPIQPRRRVEDPRPKEPEPEQESPAAPSSIAAEVEQKILHLAKEGKAPKLIATIVDLSPATVDEVLSRHGK